MTETIMSLLHAPPPPPVSLGTSWHLFLIRSLPKHLPSVSALTPNPGLATCREPLPATDLKTIINTLQGRYLILWESNSRNTIFPINNPHMCVSASLSLSPFQSLSISLSSRVLPLCLKNAFFSPASSIFPWSPSLCNHCGGITLCYFLVRLWV